MTDTYNPGGYQGYAGYGSVDWRRRIALEMLKKQRAYPKNVGEGIASAGDSVGDALIARQMKADEEARDKGLVRTANQRPLPGMPTAPPPRPAASMPAPAETSVADMNFGQLPATSQLTPDLQQGGVDEQMTRWAGQYPYSFNDASEGQSAPVPTEQPTAVAGKVPMPPPRPVYDRNAQIAELQDNPELTPRLLAMAKGEVGSDPAKQRVQLETAFNRASARGQPLSQILLDTGTNKRLGYYPPETFTRGQASPDVLTPVLRGSDEGGAALGFSPTGNASGQFAADRVRAGVYNTAGKLPGDAETYVQQETPAQLARLEASRVPGTPVNILPQAAGGIESGPRTFGGPYTQAAQRGMAETAPVPFLPADEGRNAIAAAIEPPPRTQLASLGAGLPVNDTVAAAAPPSADYKNPVIERADITPLPKTAQAAGIPPIPGVTPVTAPPIKENTIPVAPVKNEKLTDEEAYGWSIIQAHPNDPDYAKIAAPYIQWGQQQREAAYQRQVKEYDAKLEVWKKGDELERAFKYGQEARDTARAVAALKYQEDLNKLRQATPVEQISPNAPDPNIGTPMSRQRTGIPELPPIPPGTVPEKVRELHATSIAKDSEAYSKALPKFNQMIQTINQARTHPGYSSGLGVLGTIARNTPQTQAYGFNTLVDQLKGKTFLQGYQDVRGGGQISNIEGTKAELAQARLDPKQREVDFRRSLNDLESAVRGDLETMQRKMNAPVTAWQRGPDDAHAPDLRQRQRMPDGIVKEYTGGDPDLTTSWRRVQ